MTLEKIHLPMRLQFFADPEGKPADDPKPNEEPDKQPKGSEGKDNNPGGEPDKGNEKPVATFTQADVDAAINKALEQFQQKANQAKKYEQMTKEEQLEYDRQAAEKKANDAQATLARYQIRDQVRSDASKDGLVLDNADLDQIVTGDADETKANYSWLKGLRDRIKNDVLEDLKKGQPLLGNNGRLPKGSKGEQLAKGISAIKNDPYFKKGE